jgi:hypothetical protein
VQQQLAPAHGTPDARASEEGLSGKCSSHMESSRQLTRPT